MKKWTKISELWDVKRLYGKRATVTEITGPDAHEDLGMVGQTGTLCAKSASFGWVIGIKFDNDSVMHWIANLFAKDSIELLD